MSNLQRFDQDGLELVINTETGEAFTTQAGYVRMSGKAKMTISDRLKGVRNDEIKTAEIQTEGGLQGVRLIPAKLAFKWLMKDNPELAEKMGECGATVYFHRLAGYQVTSTATQPTLPPVHIQVTNFVDSLKLLDIDVTNPRWKQGIQDLVMDKILGVGNVLASNEVWLGVSEKAEQLGYSPSLVVKYRSQLGKYVKAFGLESKTEKRLCNGTQREINLYLDCPDFEQAIKEFMDAKVLVS